LRSTADGIFPTMRWKAGDHVRDRFPVAIPASWQGEMMVGLDVVGGAVLLRPLVLGVLPLAIPAGSPAPPPP
jgi:hypothetical protein